MKSSRLRSSIEYALTVGLLVATLFVISEFANTLGANTNLLRDSFVIDAGSEESLPVEVLEARELLATEGRRGEVMRMDDDLQSDALLHQRLSEALYPIRFSDDEALNRLVQLPFDTDGNCRIIRKGRHLGVVICD